MVQLLSIMTKRHPLFFYDTQRCHRFGDCDWLACVDVHYGFVCKVTYVSGENPRMETNTCVSRPNENGIQVRLDIERCWIEPGCTIPASLNEAHLKAAMRYVLDSTKVVEVDSNKPTTKQIVDYLRLIVRVNQTNLMDESISESERRTTLTSLKIINAAIQKLQDNED